MVLKILNEVNSLEIGIELFLSTPFMIEVKVINELHKLRTQIGLQELVAQLEIAEKRIAIAVNQNIISRNNWV